MRKEGITRQGVKEYCEQGDMAINISDMSSKRKTKANTHASSVTIQDPVNTSKHTI
jgi:hypothetical protein